MKLDDLLLTPMESKNDYAYFYNEAVGCLAMKVAMLKSAGYVLVHQDAVKQEEPA